MSGLTRSLAGRDLLHRTTTAERRLAFFALRVSTSPPLPFA
jgi:hypothetical protein